MHISPENIAIAVIAITLMFVIVGVSMVMYIRLYNLRRKEAREEKEKMKADFERLLFQSQLEVQEATQSTLSKELHDNVGQLLSTTKMLLGLTERSLSPVPDTFVTAHETLAKAIHELRTISKVLDREWLEQFSLVENLVTETDRINRTGAIRVLFDPPGHLPLAPDRQIILYRVIQEGLQNAIKHGAAKTLTITMEESDSLTITIRDDGKGLQGHSEGMGMKNMQQRVRLMGGTIDWQSGDGAGTMIVMRLPLKNGI